MPILGKVFRKEKSRPAEDGEALHDTTKASPNVQPSVGPLPDRAEKYGLSFLNHKQFAEDLGSKRHLYSADIVAIHGLNGDAYKTWTVDETKEMWLYHFLPAELPGARIFSFGYPSDIGFTLATGKVEDFARSLLNDLIARRSAAEDSSRPIIFVCHSMGGLVVKQALITAKLDDNDYGSIRQSVVGILFFATPHRGSAATQYPEVLANVANFALAGASGVTGRMRTELLEILSKDSESLVKLATDFRNQTAHIKIVSFIEQNTTPPLKTRTVDDSSGVLGMANETIVPMAGCDHRQICRFKSSSSSGYLIVLGHIKKLAGGPTALTPDQLDCLRSLGFDKAGHRQMDIANAHTGTCDWLFTHWAYHTWLHREDLARHSGILWIRGKPGSGKSTLVKHVLVRIQKLFGNSASVLSFFFNARGDMLERSAAGFYRSLLSQILKQHRICPSELLSMYQGKKLNSEKVEWHSTELRDSLGSALLQQGQRPIYLFIDALDECQDTQQRHNQAPWKEIVNFLEDLASSGSDCSLINICVSRRHYPNLPDKPLEVSLDGLNDGDIEKYLQAKLTRSPDFDAEIRNTLVQKAQGIFLWVVLVVASLNDTAHNPHSRKELTHILEAIPEDLESIFQKIAENFSQPHRKSSQQLFQWVLFAGRPLYVAELTYALACNVSHHSLVALESGEEFVSIDRMEQRIRFLSGGLIEVSRVTSTNRTNKGSIFWGKPVEKPRVQSIHESVRDYFLSGAGWSSFQSSPTTNNVAGSSHEMLKASCINYLLLEEIQLESTRYAEDEDGCRNYANSQFAVTLQHTFLFLNYALNFVFYHASKAEMCGLPQNSLGERFLDSSDSFFEVWAALHAYLTYSPKYLEGKNAGLSILVELGIFTSLQTVHEKHGALGSENFFGCTSLHLAVENGHLNVVQLLLKGHVDIDSDRHRGETPLLLASEKGHWQIVKALLDGGADVSAKPGCLIPLIEAILAGHETIAKLLLERGADANTTGYTRVPYERYVTPLQAAMDAGLQRGVKLLLENGADVNAEGGNFAFYPDYCEGTALVRAAYSGNTTILLMLLNEKADINNCVPITPLQMAIQRSHLDVARILLDRGAEVDAGGPDGTALFIAASRKENAIAALQLLLEHRAELNLSQHPKDCPSHESETALHAATESSNADAVLFLLSKGVDINPPSQAGRTPLELAAGENNHTVFELLLGKGADTEKLKDRRDAILARAACHGNIMMINQLLLAGIDVNIPDRRFGPAICIAAATGDVPLLQLLIEAGADIEADGRRSHPSPLWRAARYEHITSVQLLLEHGAQVDSNSAEWGTALSAAACADNLPIALLLLQSGANVNLPGNYGSPLSLAAELASKEMVELLLSCGAQIDSETQRNSRSSSNALANAVRKRRRDIVEIILDKGANVHGPLALALVTAAEQGQDDIIELLLAHGADINATAGTDRLGSPHSYLFQYVERLATPLSAAARLRWKSTVKFLLDRGADPNAHSGLALQSCVRRYKGLDILDLLIQLGGDVNCVGGKYGSVLVAACAKDREDLVGKLLIIGANPNPPMCGKYGSPLHAAVHSGNIKTVRVLLQKGANPHATHKDYGNVLHACGMAMNPQNCDAYLLSHMVEEMVDLCLGLNVDVNSPGGTFGTALQAACYFSCEALVRGLLDRGAAIHMNQPMSQCGTALHAAAASGSIEIARLLLDRGADINVSSGTHGTPILAAAADGDFDMVKFLMSYGADIHAQCGENGTILQNAISAILEDFDVSAYVHLGQTENEASSMERDHSIEMDEQQYDATKEDLEEAENKTFGHHSGRELR